MTAVLNLTLKLDPLTSTRQYIAGLQDSFPLLTIMFMSNVLVTTANQTKKCIYQWNSLTFFKSQSLTATCWKHEHRITKMPCHFSPCGIPGRQSGTGAGFLFTYFSFTLPLAFHQCSMLIHLPQMLYNLSNWQHHYIKHMHMHTHTHTMPATSAVRNFMRVRQADVISGHFI